MQGFDRLIPDARRFLAALSQSNTRDWFLANKDSFDAELRGPAEALVDVVAADLARLTGLSCKGKLFRQHRDVRFSRDKSPYKTHLHMLWTTTASGGGAVSWFFGIELEGLRMGAGRWRFDSQELARWRAGVAQEKGALLQTRLGAAQDAGLTLGAPDLKRVPAPYPTDHPRAELLRHKSFGLWQRLDEPVTDLPARLHEGFARHWPVQQSLLDILDG